MKTALVGHTGFVGSNLASRHRFDSLYNTQNIDEIVGQDYDLVVSAANRADAFRINRNPDDDLRDIDGLVDRLSQATIKRVVLVSTVCVYPAGTSPDEETPLRETGLAPYGRNRLHQERRLGDLFETTIVRLPQLYGDNLKKGLLHDLSNDYRVEFIDPNGAFQYYDVRRLWHDTQVVLEHGLSSFNMSNPAIAHTRVASEVFGVDISRNEPEAADAFSSMYSRDMRTRHADLFDSRDGYLLDVDSELNGIRDFAATLASGAGRQ